MRLILFILLAMVALPSPLSAKEAVSELRNEARVLYQAGRWAEFFGLAHYIRAAYPPSVQNDRLRLLEGLALLRHCQFADAKALIEVDVPTAPVRVAQGYQTTLEFLEVIPGLPVKGEQDLSKLPQGAFARSRLWPVNHLDITRLDPHKFRKPVTSVCTGANSKGTPSDAQSNE